MTRLRALRVRELRIPFTVTFRHASAERAETSSVWVEATSVDDVTGYGESCPRSYVTGEILAGSLAFAAGLEADLVRSIVDVDSLRAWMQAHAEAIDRHPAARCA